VRRQHTLDDFAKHVYGWTPQGGRIADVVLHSRVENALGGKAVRIEADLVFAGPKGNRSARLLVYAPAGATRAPTFLGLNFAGNHTTTDEPDVRISPAAQRVAALHGEEIPKRGAQSERWPLDFILSRGYAVATLWYEELEVDLPGHGDEGIRGMFDTGSFGTEAWGALGGWAWALSRILDALAVFEEIDVTRVLAVGHSRLGKAALWASAQDERFAAIISNESGCGGASLFRHHSIEDIALITSVRPHWFAEGFANYRGREDALPVDQHQLIALQAPRPTHVGSAIEDLGADPYGEFLSTIHASPVFELFGHGGTLSPGTIGRGADVGAELALEQSYPQTDRRIGGRLSYHVREGKHGMVESDWRHILDFADATVLGDRRSETRER
jgi:hypothetical protein